eukprot:scaffold212_cov404-Prasinococcus_capsulatus_cf.AAC.11
MASGQLRLLPRMERAVPIAHAAKKQTVRVPGNQSRQSRREAYHEVGPQHRTGSVNILSRKFNHRPALRLENDKRLTEHDIQEEHQKDAQVYEQGCQYSRQLVLTWCQGWGRWRRWRHGPGKVSVPTTRQSLSGPHRCEGAGAKRTRNCTPRLWLRPAASAIVTTSDPSTRQACELCSAVLAALALGGAGAASLRQRQRLRLRNICDLRRHCRQTLQAKSRV